jgi:O-methyltransferase involved in polyketide biosynthesis
VTDSSSTPGQQPPEIDTSVAHSARVWNYFLGGKDYFPADQQAAEMALELMPSLVEAARADRGFLARAVRFLAGEAGIRQFLDIGTGLPTADNTHQVAQAVAPQSRIVYVDNDPLVLVHARALLASSPEGATDYIEADLRDPDKILDGAAATLDFEQPTALMLLGIVNFIVDDTQAHQIVGRLLGALPSGSYLAMTHPTTEVHGEEVTEAMRQWNQSGAAPICARGRQELAGFFEGLELLEPGVVSSSQWRPDPADSQPVEVAEYCAVGRKP